jgi:hypothetical protein
MSVAGGIVTLPFATFRGNIAQGGTGGSGGLTSGMFGGLGEGGAGGGADGGGAYILAAAATLDYSHFLANQAVGGTGGAAGAVSGGGWNGPGGAGGHGWGGGLRADGLASVTIHSGEFLENLAQGGNGGNGAGGFGGSTGGTGGTGGTGQGGAIHLTHANMFLRNSTPRRNHAVGGLGGMGGTGIPPGLPGANGAADDGGAFVASDATLSAPGVRFIDNDPA